MKMTKVYKEIEIPINECYPGYTPRLLATCEFINREKFKLRSKDEILSLYNSKLKENDFLGFSHQVIFNYLPYDEILKHIEDELTIDEISKKSEHLTLEYTVQKMLDYLVFGWSKILDERGISCSRNIYKLKAYLYLLNRDDLAEQLDEDYQDYGKETILQLFKSLQLYNPITINDLTQLHYNDIIILSDNILSYIDISNSVNTILNKETEI